MELRVALIVFKLVESKFSYKCSYMYMCILHMYTYVCVYIHIHICIYVYVHFHIYVAYVYVHSPFLFHDESNGTLEQVKLIFQRIKKISL